MQEIELESIENATVLAALTFIDISGALIGAFISIAAYITLAVNSKQFPMKIPLKKLRLISGILLTITATPLIARGWFTWSRLVTLDYSAPWIAISNTRTLGIIFISSDTIDGPHSAFRLSNIGTLLSAGFVLGLARG